MAKVTIIVEDIDDSVTLSFDFTPPLNNKELQIKNIDAFTNAQYVALAMIQTSKDVLKGEITDINGKNCTD